MQEIENATIVCHSTGENNVIVVKDETTGKTISLLNHKGLELELGMEGRMLFREEPVKQLVNFELILKEELALEEELV
jgi:hypothetical protein